MVENILEYVLMADRYFQLWMVAEKLNPQPQNQVNGTRLNTNMVQTRKDWHPSLVSQFDDVRDVPSIVQVDMPEFSIDKQGRFHTGSKKATLDVETLTLFWGVDFVYDTEKHMDERHRVGHSSRHVLEHPIRAEGPAKITFSGVKMWHHQSQLHRRRGDAIIIEQVMFEWNCNERSGGASRPGGPFKVVLQDFRARADMGRVYDGSHGSMNVSWCAHSGARLGESRVYDVIEKHGIKVNYLAAGESVFLDAGEEFIFWTEIEEDEAA